MTDSSDDNLLSQLGQRARESQQRDALRPLGDAFNARMVQQIKDSLGESDIEEEQPLASSHRTAGRGWLALAASALAAVGLSFVVLDRDALPPLPGYELSLSSGATLRSDDAIAPLQIGDTLQVTLRPEFETDADLDVRVYRHSNSDWTNVSANIEIAASGAARVRVALTEANGIAPGTQDWWFVIGHDDALPSIEQLQDTEAASDEHWSAFRRQFELVP
jgi:hypothetical protein